MDPVPLHLTNESFSVSRSQKEKLNGHKALTIWLTGLPAAGKSTIGRHLEEILHDKGIRTLMLDGDNTRMGINKDLGFSAAGRKENIRRVAEIARLLNDAGVVTICCFISPLIVHRQMAKQVIGSDCFVTVFVDTPVALCKQRDPKGLYKKAIAGEINDFTGVSAPYEPPVNADIHIDTGNTTASDAAQQILDWLITNRKLVIQTH